MKNKDREQVVILLKEIKKNSTEIKRLLELVLQQREGLDKLAKAFDITVDNATQTDRDLATEVDDLFDSIDDIVSSNF